MSAGADEPQRAAAGSASSPRSATAPSSAGPPLVGFLGDHVTVLRALTAVAVLLGLAALLTAVVAARARSRPRKARRRFRPSLAEREAADQDAVVAAASGRPGSRRGQFQIIAPGRPGPAVSAGTAARTWRSWRFTRASGRLPSGNRPSGTRRAGRRGLVDRLRVRGAYSATAVRSARPGPRSRTGELKLDADDADRPDDQGGTGSNTRL